MIAQGNGRKLCKHEHIARVIAVPDQNQRDFPGHVHEVVQWYPLP